VIGKREALLEELRKELRGLHASLVQAVNSNLAALDLQQPAPVPVPVPVSESAVAGPGSATVRASERVPAAATSGPRMGLGADELEEKTEGVYL
jgi:hypothetical protein